MAIGRKLSERLMLCMGVWTQLEMQEGEGPTILLSKPNHFNNKSHLSSIAVD